MREQENRIGTSMEDILQQLEEGVREFLQSDRYQSYLRAMSKFHRYSVNNILLITMQQPDASIVAGYSTWKKSFHRSVKRGEKGIRIIAPIPTPVKRKVVREGKEEEVEITIPRFRTVTVFDISQTEGPPLPDLSPKELQGQDLEAGILFDAVRSVSPVPVQMVPRCERGRGLYDSLNGRIQVQENLTAHQAVKTLIHEVAHATMHQKPGRGDRSTMEVEAESVAYCVCNYFGLDTSDYSFPYIGAWSKDQELSQLRSSLEDIRGTASELIQQVEERYLERLQLAQALPTPSLKEKEERA